METITLLANFKIYWFSKMEFEERCFVWVDYAVHILMGSSTNLGARSGIASCL